MNNLICKLEGCDPRKTLILRAYLPERVPSIQGGPGYVDTIIFSVITSSREKPIAEIVMFPNWPESENI